MKLTGAPCAIFNFTSARRDMNVCYSEIWLLSCNRYVRVFYLKQCDDALYVDCKSLCSRRDDRLLFCCRTWVDRYSFRTQGKW